MMRRLGLFMVAVLFIAAVSGGCDNFKGDDGVSVTRTEFDKKGTLTGFIRNAVTNAPISYTTEGENMVKLYLMDGTNKRTPDALITNATEALCGLYVYNNIPFTLYGNWTAQMVVNVPGYQTFVTNITPRALVATFGTGLTTDGGGAITTEFENFLSELTRVDGSYQGLGNIYLFPIGCTAGDITVKVRDPLGRDVPNAIVRLQPNLPGSVPVVEIGNRLLPAAGQMPVFTATTSEAGLATFSETTLVLGGQYTPISEPLTYMGQQLAGAAAAAFIVGTNNVHIQIAPANLDPALYVISSSNSVPGTITASGVLTMRFDKTITLNTETLATQFTAVVTDTAAVTATVAASLDVSGTVLTLTPTFTPAAGPTGPGATITYTHAATGLVFLKDTQINAGNIGGAGGAFTVTDLTGNAVPSVVQMITR